MTLSQTNALTSLDAAVVTGDIISKFKFKGPALVEASAGTGKTYTITGLVVRLLLGDYGEDVELTPLSIDKMAIMTFTNAATYDLKRKIRERIHSTRIALQSPEGGDELVQRIRKLFTDPKDPNKLKAAILLLTVAERDIDRASISTIHSFCGGLLKRYATGAQIALNAEFIKDDSALKEEALVYAIRELTYNQNLEEAFVAPSVESPLSPETAPLLGTASLAEDVANNFTTPGGDVKLNSEFDFNASRSNFAFFEFLRLNNLINTSKLIDDFSDYSAVTVNMFKRLKVNNRVANYASLAEIGRDFYCRGGRMKPRPGVTVDLSEIGKLEKKETKNNSTEDSAYVNMVKDCIFRRALEIFERLKNNLGVLTSDDYLFRLDYALKTKSEAGMVIASEVRRQYPVMFIDEFQDTDPVQFDIVKRIYLDYFAQPGNDWYQKIGSSKIPTGFYIIGDPKQAIYSFRGADIDCYLKARAAVKSIAIGKGKGPNVYRLDTNYRSDSNLVQAVNYLFDPRYFGRSLMLGREHDIAFEPVKSPQGRELSGFSIEQSNFKAFNFLVLKDSTGNKEERKNLVAKHAVKTIVELMLGGTLTRQKIRQKIRYQDIAILVNAEADAQIIEKYLTQAGIPYVYGSERATVQGTPEFKAIIALMRACCSPRREEIIKLLVSSLFNFTAQELDALLIGEKFDQLVHFLTECTVMWREQGFMALMMKFLFTREVFGSWSINDELSATPGGSQIFTNIMHTAEIAQALSLNAKAPENLLPLMEGLVDQPEGTEQLLETGIDPVIRLPAVEEVVKIVTSHASKGLEYPIVLMPFAGFGRKKNGKTSFCYVYNEDDENRTRLYDITVGNTEGCKAFEAYVRDNSWEQTRLWYVAATRARHAMFVWVDESKNSNNEIPAPAKTVFNDFMSMQTQAEVERLFKVEEFTPQDCVVPDRNWRQRDTQDFTSLAVEIPTANMIDAKWRISSYSGLTAVRGTKVRPDIENEALQHREDDPVLMADDDLTSIDFEPLKPTSASMGVKHKAEASVTPKEPLDLAPKVALDSAKLYTRFTFPRGAAAGTFLHDVLEHVSFSTVKTKAPAENSLNTAVLTGAQGGALGSSTGRTLEDALTHSLKNIDYNAVSAVWRPQVLQNDNTVRDGLGFAPLSTWLRDVIETPLGGFKLQDLSDKNCVKEMEFLLSMPNTSSSGFYSTAASNQTLNGLINDFYKREDPQMLEYVKEAQVSFADVKGLMTGFIDLLAIHEGRFYVIDYKSNHLGDEPEAYSYEAMKKAVAAHRYDVQYLIYTVAVHRFLKKVYGSKYSYDMIGGVRYLFLRGMSGSSGLGAKGTDKEANTYAPGVFGLRLPEDLINELDAYFGGTL
ncbi:MAG: UvrD-helicase domain-containing protein [Succinivibrionaceae bacterium]|nr:UvrD-helicase domain-containing protein [Succinivibrionaceae bacterium]